VKHVRKAFAGLGATALTFATRTVVASPPSAYADGVGVYAQCVVRVTTPDAVGQYVFVTTTIACRGNEIVILTGQFGPFWLNTANYWQAMGTVPFAADNNYQDTATAVCRPGAWVGITNAQLRFTGTGVLTPAAQYSGMEMFKC